MADYSFGSVSCSDTSYNPNYPWVGRAVAAGPHAVYCTVPLTLSKRCKVAKLAFKGWSVGGQQMTYRLTLNGKTYSSATKPTGTSSVQPLTFAPNVVLNAGNYTAKVEITNSDAYGYLGMQLGVFQVDASNCSITKVTQTVTLPTSVTGATLNKTGAQTVDYGSTLSFTVTTTTGYTQNAPVVKYGSTTLTGTKSGNTYSYTTPAVTANTTVTVTAALDTFVVKYNANGGSSTPASQTKTYGVALTLRGAITKTASSSTVTGYTVTYNANSGSGAPGSQTSERTKTVTYTFKEWNTKSDGTGTSYAAGASYTGNAALTLYAIWTSSTSYTNKAITLSSISPTRSNSVTNTDYTLTFNANQGSGAPAAQTGTKTVTITYTFKGWGTSAGATTASYQPGDSMTPSANTTLYAVWQSSTNTVNATVTVPNTQPTRTGFTFMGWATSASATSKDSAYDPGNTVTLTGNKTVYAVWKALLSYTVSYDANGGSGAPNEQYVYQGDSLTLTTETPSKADVVDTVSGYTLSYNANGGSGAPASQTSQRTRTRQYTFDHWNTAEDGTGTSYSPGDTITPSGDMTLYAIYSLTNTTYVEQELSVSETIPISAGHVFKEWNTSSDGSGTAVSPGEDIQISANLTLYAIWAPNGLAHVYDESASSYLSMFCKIWTNGSYQQHLPYVYENGEWVLRG